jgi:hypothetical protein
MGTDGSLLVLAFALCGAGALTGLAVPERRIPAFLAWVGSVAALAMLWVSADVLRSGAVFRSELWTIEPLGLVNFEDKRDESSHAGYLMLAPGEAVSGLPGSDGGVPDPSGGWRIAAVLSAQNRGRAPRPPRARDPPVGVNC